MPENTNKYKDAKKLDNTGYERRIQQSYRNPEIF